MLATYNNDFYDIVKVLHIMCAIIGFGGVLLNGLYGAQAKARGGAAAAGIAHANFRVTQVAEYFIYATLLLGLALVGLGNNLFDFGQTWIWLSIVIFVAALGVSHGLMTPRVKRMNVLFDELAAVPAGGSSPPPQAAELDALTRQVAALSVVLDVAFVVLLVFMVFKPGGPRL